MGAALCGGRVADRARDRVVVVEAAPTGSRLGFLDLLGTLGYRLQGVAVEVFHERLGGVHGRVDGLGALLLLIFEAFLLAQLLVEGVLLVGELLLQRVHRLDGARPVVRDAVEHAQTGAEVIEARRAEQYLEVRDAAVAVRLRDRRGKRFLGRFEVLLGALEKLLRLVDLLLGRGDLVVDGAEVESCRFGLAGQLGKALRRLLDRDVRRVLELGRSSLRHVHGQACRREGDRRDTCDDRVRNLSL